jgi:hypothetical protein
MENQAYKWLRQWHDNGYWRGITLNRVLKAYISKSDKLYSKQIIEFRDDLDQLLADAEAGRKMREDEQCESDKISG